MSHILLFQDTTTYELPDGIIVPLGRAQYMAPEILFCCGGEEGSNVTNIVVESVRLYHNTTLNNSGSTGNSGSCGSCGGGGDTSKSTLNNVYLCGGTSNLPGFGTRLSTEVNKITNNNKQQVTVHSPPQDIKGTLLFHFPSFFYPSPPRLLSLVLTLHLSFYIVCR